MLGHCFYQNSIKHLGRLSVGKSYVKYKMEIVDTMHFPVFRERFFLQLFQNISYICILYVFCFCYMFIHCICFLGLFFLCVLKRYVGLCSFILKKPFSNNS